MLRNRTDLFIFAAFVLIVVLIIVFLPLLVPPNTSVFQ